VGLEGVSKTGYAGNGVLLQKFHNTLYGIGKKLAKERRNTVTDDARTVQ
jgi:hypothetical protein